LELMCFIRRDKDGVPGLDWLFTVLVSNLALPFKDVHLVFPIVFVIGCETARFEGELAHEKGRGSMFLIDDPFYSRSLGAFLRDWGIRNTAHVHLVQS